MESYNLQYWYFDCIIDHILMLFCIVQYTACVFNVVAQVFRETFKSLSAIKPSVLYPIPDFASLSLDNQLSVTKNDLFPASAKHVLVSINRFERKKNLPLAINALGKI